MTIEPALVVSVIDQLCTTRTGLVRHGTGAAQTDGDRIETPYLQLVMTRLWTEEQRQGSLVLRTETLAALGDTTAIVANYLHGIMEALSEEEQDRLARRFDRLVTRSGSKVAKTQADMVEYAGGSQQVVEQLLRTLVGQRVLQVVPYTLGESRYEITHDVLGQAILQWQERFQLRRISAEKRSGCGRKHNRYWPK